MHPAPSLVCCLELRVPHAYPCLPPLICNAYPGRARAFSSSSYRRQVRALSNIACSLLIFLSVVFVVEPTLAPDDSRRGPRDIDGRKWSIQVQGINGAPAPTPPDRQSRRMLSRRRESVGAGTASLRSGASARPRTIASIGTAPEPHNRRLSSTTNLGLDDEAHVHAVWFLQCPDADARQRWISCIKRAVLLQRLAFHLAFFRHSRRLVSILCACSRQQPGTAVQWIFYLFTLAAPHSISSCPVTNAIPVT